MRLLEPQFSIFQTRISRATYQHVWHVLFDLGLDLFDLCMGISFVLLFFFSFFQLFVEYLLSQLSTWRMV